MTPDLGAPDRYAIPAAQAEAIRLQGHAPVPQLALVQGQGRRADRRSRLAPDRHLQLVPRRQPLARDGERRHCSTTSRRRTSGTTRSWSSTTTTRRSGPAKAYYQTQTTNGSQGYFESFMGDQGTLLISESEVNYPGLLYRDPNAPAWDEWIQKGYVSAPQGAGGEGEERLRARLPTCASRSRRTSTPCRSRCATPTTSRTCRTSSTPSAARRRSIARPRSATRPRSAVLKVNEAIEAKSRLAFKPEEFKI